MLALSFFCFFFFFFNDTATTEIYTLSLHDALPISRNTPLVKRASGSSGFFRRVSSHSFSRREIVESSSLTRFSSRVVDGMGSRLHGQRIKSRWGKLKVNRLPGQNRG